MMIIFVLSMICDVCLYMTFANLFTNALFADIIAMFVPPLIMIAVAAGAYLLHKAHPKLRFLPLLLLPVCFYPAQGLVTFLLLSIPCVYVAAVIWLKKFYLDPALLRERVKLCAMMVFLPLLFVLFKGYAYLVSSYYFQHLLIYICCAICLLRITRIDIAVFAPRFIIINLAPVIGGFVALAVLSSTRVLSAIWQGLGLVITHIILPVGRFFIRLMDWLESKIKYDTALPGAGEISRMRVGIFGDMNATPDAAPLNPVIQWIFIVLFIAFAIFVLRKLLLRPWRRQAASGVFEVRASVASLPEEPLFTAKQRLFTPRDPRLAVRHHYRQFLRMCAEKGCPPERGDTSKDINVKNHTNFAHESMVRLRDLYLKARYSHHAIESRESKEAGELVKHL